MGEPELPATAAEADARHRFARSTWLSPQNCRALSRAAVEHPLDT